MWTLVFPDMSRERFEGVGPALDRLEGMAVSKGWHGVLFDVEKARDTMYRGQYKDTFCFKSPMGYFMVDTDDRWS